MNLDQFASLLERAAVKATPELEKAIVKLGPIVVAAAKEMIGHEHASWPPLAASTIEDKERRGYAVPDPLLRTGDLRDSIVAIVEVLTLAVGSEEKNARYQEQGTHKMPPRPFLAPAMLESLPAATALIVEAAEKLFIGR
jgi:HK97 gp10 family phage protein